MDVNKVPKSELSLRLTRFVREMDIAFDSWEMCALTGATGLFYLTGTICDGVLLILRSGDATLWVRRSYERALLESEFPDIRKMTSFRTVAESIGAVPDTLYLDTSSATLEWYSMLSKHVPFKNVESNDKAMMNTRSIKSEYELDRLRRAGAQINRLLSDEFPMLANEGISEAVLGAKLLTLFIENGHHGIARFNMRNSAELLGHIAFGDGALYPGVFNGASGIAGLSPAAPALGRNNRYLRLGDLVFVDVCFGVEGYHVDKTVIFSYKHQQTDEVMAAHQHCLELERHAASMLKPGEKPSAIYDEVLSMVSPKYVDNFMGARGRTVPFIGHSVGLSIDETPVLAKGFDAPLVESMAIAIEPKISIDGIGMVGSENTYLVTNSGGLSLSGNLADIALIE